MTKKTTLWILFFAVLCAAALALFFLLRNARVDGSTACIYVDGELYDTVDLDTVTKAYEIRIEREDSGYNIISVAPGQIAVTEASCPDQICVHQGWIENSLIPITCLPNRVVVEIEGEA